MAKESKKFNRLSRSARNVLLEAPDNKILKQVRDDKKKRKIKVAIAMSGGVDSSVAAKMLVDQGYDVVGFMMKLWSDPNCPNACSRENACCDDKGVMDAKKVADQLGIPFYVVDARAKFKKAVADYFLSEYKKLRTPNPCVVCNEKIKFGWLLDFAKKAGCQFLATGHYARIALSNYGNPKLKILNPKQISNSNIQSVANCHPELDSGSGSYCVDSGSRDAVLNEDITYHLFKGKDELKDQSYFLYRLNQEQLKHILFPVGEYTKDQVRAMAKKWHLPVYNKRESQEICFIHDKDFRDYLKRNISASYFKSGDIVDAKGNVLGRHEGLINYTIGQRKGVDQTQNLKVKPQNYGNHSVAGLSDKQLANTNKQPLYVIGFDKRKNRLMVGEDTLVHQTNMIVKNISWTNKNIESGILNSADIKIKIRYRHPAVPCAASIQHSAVRIQFKEPQRAITPGQSAVFYFGDEVLGGGIIS